MSVVYPKISIITPSYNQGHFIEQTIESVLSQNYPNLEYMIFDGGSTDNTVEIIKKYEKHITYWESVKDKGQSDAINKGFKRATGDIINWLNSDDYYESGALKHVANVFLQKTNTLVYAGKSRVFGIPNPYYSNGTDIFPGNLEKTIAWARIDQPETFFKKSVLDKIGFLNPALHYCMDKELWLRFLVHYGLNNVVKDDQLLVHFRIHNQSKTASLQEKFKEETKEILNEYLLKYTGHPTGIAIDWNRVQNYLYLKNSMEAYAQNDYARAKQYIHALKTDLLNHAEKDEVKKIKLRMTLIPVFIKRWYNRRSDL